VDSYVTISKVQSRAGMGKKRDGSSSKRRRYRYVGCAV